MIRRQVRRETNPRQLNANEGRRRGMRERKSQTKERYMSEDMERERKKKKGCNKNN
jgi:hypothetical protein